MTGYRLSVERSYVGGVTDCAYVRDGEEPRDEIVSAAIEAIATDLMVRVGGVTMFLAAWQDPEHWTEEWAEKLDVERDDVVAEVEGLIASAREES